MNTPRALRLAFALVAGLAIVGCQQAGGEEAAAWSTDETGMLVSPRPTGPAPAFAMDETWQADETGMLVSPRPTLEERVDASLYAAEVWSVDETGLLETPRPIESAPESLIETLPAN